MKNNTRGRFLRIAIVGSLFVHAIFAMVVRSHPVQAAPEQLAHPLGIVHIVLPTPTPVPPKPNVPHPADAPKPSVAHRPPMKLPELSKDHSGAAVDVASSAAPGTPGPPVDATPGAGPSGPPQTPAAATPTPKPACSAPDVDAKTVAAVTPERPPEASSGAASAQVRVELDANGNVTAASIYQSSGDQVLDMAAVRAAKASRYAPEERDCKNVPGSYLFNVDFQE